MSKRPLGCLFEVVETLVLTLVIFLVIQNFIAQPYRVQQQSMEHTLEPDQYVLVDKLTPRFDDFKRGDIVVFNPPPAWSQGDGTPYIKRVIGIGGDRIDIREGRVFVNGTPLDEPYIFEGQETVVTTDGSWSQHDRHLDDPVFLSRLSSLKPEEIDWPGPAGYDPMKNLYQAHQNHGHRWAMAIDLSRCVGCETCMAACYAENNIGVVGKDWIAQGREMYWLRITRYFEWELPQPALFLPMLCQHCDAAPCEPVCPVFASVHNEEGLNAQVYNRCIGTRYCNNNCPWKVRRFNWRNYDWPESLTWQLNPDVTVRSRGVMEKCTFCIQRIREVEHRAAREQRPVQDGEITPACTQACPAGVFTFGDLMDTNSRVYKLFTTNRRRYQVLRELNTKPAVIYLRKVINDE